jgi:tRNA(Ile)-lysidine synthase
VVDHALREDSDADAQRALSLARAREVEAQMVTLAWAPDETRSQETARRKRYAALSAEARKQGAAVLTAHTADDQAETVLMRAKAGSGWRGLAGVAAEANAPLWPEGRGVRLLRPLLHTRRQELRALLATRGVEWIEDPANSSDRFERVRVRAELAELERVGFDPMRLVRLADRLRPLVNAVDAEARALIAAAASFDGGVIRVQRAAWQGGIEARRRALAVLIAAAAGLETLADADATARLEARCVREDFRGATLGGAELSPARDAIVLNRDPGALIGRAGLAPITVSPLVADVETIWDGRLAIVPAEAGWCVTIDRQARPVLQRAETILPLAEATAQKIVKPVWLTEAAVSHRLGGENAPPPGLSER